MKAIKLAEPRQVDCVELEKPVPGPGQALIRIKTAGICGSDIGAFRGTNKLVSYPRIIGHELAGIIEEIPADNPKGLKPGDKVIVDPYLYCGKCYPCSIGRTNCCTDLKVLGVHIDGGMAEYFCHPADMLVKMPEDMDWTAYGAHAILLDLVQERLDFAKELGIEYVINSSNEDPETRVREITGGMMAQQVMECSGANAAVRLILDLVSHAGRVTLTGWPPKETSIPTDLITRKEIDIRGARTSAGEFEEAIQLIYTKKVDVAKILTKTIGLGEAPDTIRDIEKNPGNYMKVVVKMD